MHKHRDVIGHEQQRTALQEDLASGNISHAYLFAGPPHIGKMTVAHWFAQSLLSTSDDDIRHIEKRMHPDFLVLDQLWIEGVCEDWDAIAESSNVPQVHRSKKSSPAKTDTISIDDIRALQERLHEKSIGAHSCCIIRSLERMQDTAANALLKIIEEPPTGLTFLFTTQSLPAILPTIISRTRVLQFHTLPQKLLRSHLDGVDEDDTQFILRVAQGAPGTLLRLRDNPDALLAEKQLQGAAQTFWDAASLHTRLQMLAPLRQKGQAAERFLFHLALALREQPIAARTHNTVQFLQLLRTLETNANPQLASQAFALHVVQ